MTLMLKEFNIAYDSNKVGATAQTASVSDVTTNPMKLQVFYDDQWAKEPRHAVVFFSGGTGFNSETIDHVRPKHVVEKGYLYINLIAHDPTKEPMNYVLNAMKPTFDMPMYVFEVETAIDKIYAQLPSDANVGSFFNPTSKLVLTGTDRGAINILQWSALTLGSFAANRNKVVGLVANSPATLSNPDLTLPSPYGSLRCSYQAMRHAKHPTKVTIGAGDITGISRANAERLFRGVVNDNLTIQIVGDESYNNSWINANPHYVDFLNPTYQILDSIPKPTA